MGAGEHRLLRGKSLEPQNYERLLGGRKIDAVFADAPYNIKIEGVVSGLEKTKHKNFAMGVGEMSDDEFLAFRSKKLLNQELRVQIRSAGCVVKSYRVMESRW